MPINFEVATAAKNIFAEKSPGVGVGYRFLHNLQQIAVLAANVDVSSAGPDREPGNHCAFNHRMRIVLKDQPVLTGARFAFVTIAQNVFRLRRLLGNGRPLQSSVESGAAATAQSRIFDLIDDRIRLHSERFAYGLVAVKLKIAVDVRSALSKALRHYAHL